MSAAPAAVKRKQSIARKKPPSDNEPKESPQQTSTLTTSDGIKTNIVRLHSSPKTPMRRLGSASERSVHTTVPSGPQNIHAAGRPQQSIENNTLQSVSAKEDEDGAYPSGSEGTNVGWINEETLPGLRLQFENGTPIRMQQYLTSLDTAKLLQEVEALDKKAEKKVATAELKENLYATNNILVRSNITDNNTHTENKVTTRPLPHLPENQVQTESSPGSTNGLQTVAAGDNCQNVNKALPESISSNPGTSSKPDPSAAVDAASPKRTNETGCSTRDFCTELASTENDLVNKAARIAHQNSSNPKTNEEKHQIPRDYGMDYLKSRANNEKIDTGSVRSPEYILRTALALRSQVSLDDSSADTLNKRDIVQQLLIATEKQINVTQSEGGTTRSSESRRESGRSSSSLPTYCGRPPSVDPDNAITAAVASQAPKELASQMIYRVMHECRFSGAEDLEVKAEEIVKGIPDPDNPHAGKKTLVASVCRPGRKGYVPNFFLKRITQIDFEPWYLGKITIQYAEQLLLECDLPVRSFLVRHSGLGYIISVKSLNNDGRLIVKHKTIAEVNGKYSMFNRDFFDTIPELVSFHTTRQGGYCFSHPFQKPMLGLSPGILAPVPEIPEVSVETIGDLSPSIYRPNPHAHHLTPTTSRPPPHTHHLTPTTSRPPPHAHHLTPTTSRPPPHAPPPHAPHPTPPTSRPPPHAPHLTTTTSLIYLR